MNERYPCPCCGSLTYQDRPGKSDEICPVCKWQSDRSALIDPFEGSSPNGMSLYDAQKIFCAQSGFDDLCERQGFSRDLDWRPIDRARDRFRTTVDPKDIPADPNKLYYWRSSYWLNDKT
jgi:hypothetical protein